MTLAQQMKKTVIIMALLLASYLGLYVVARATHVLVMYDGYRGAEGVGVADLGPVPPETVVVCGVARMLFRPLMKIETLVRER